MRRDPRGGARSWPVLTSPAATFVSPGHGTDLASEIGEVDWSLRAEAPPDEARALIEPRSGPSTRLALMNGLGLEEHFSRDCLALPHLRGLAFTCTRRGEPGVVRHPRLW